MKAYRGLSSTAILSLLAGVVVPLFLSVGFAYAQTATVSTSTIQVSGTVSAKKSGLGEDVTFSGPLMMTTKVLTDPIRPPIVFISINGLGIKGIGNKTGTVYLNECEAGLHRRFGAKDVIKTTFAFFAKAPRSYLASKTGLLTLNLNYDTTTKKLTKATGSVSTP
ncbi:MAG TPA: hypothetical protein VN380_04745 [Thermoanaerobaculia bacterium]|jgi:hypothetical protein|nr:hypothetical protein [Thermoanaerobaculia bacterium]